MSRREFYHRKYQIKSFKFFKQSYSHHQLVNPIRIHYSKSVPIGNPQFVIYQFLTSEQRDHLDVSSRTRIRARTLFHLFVCRFP